MFGEPHLPIKLDSLFLAATWALYVFVTIAINLGFFHCVFPGALERFYRESRTT